MNWIRHFSNSLILLYKRLIESWTFYNSPKNKIEFQIIEKYEKELNFKPKTFLDIFSTFVKLSSPNFETIWRRVKMALGPRIFDLLQLQQFSSFVIGAAAYCMLWARSDTLLWGHEQRSKIWPKGWENALHGATNPFPLFLFIK